MLFFNFSQSLQNLESTPSRLDMTRIIAELFGQLDPSELVVACYLMQGRLVPLYQSLEFNLSEKMVIRSLARLLAYQAEGSSNQNLFGETDFSQREEIVKAKFKQLGDLGLVAEELTKQFQSELSIVQVFDQLVKIAKYEGNGSQEMKVNGLADLIKRLEPLSAKFVVRMVIGKMRLGFSNMTMIDALSWSVTGDKSESDILEEAYNKKADIGQLASNYLSLKKSSSAQRQKMLLQTEASVSIPVVPALCQRLNSAAEMVEKMGRVVVEPKYDGMRVQIHFDQNKEAVQAFTRNLEDVGAMFPELKQLKKITSAKTLILDAEAIGFDTKTQKLMAFQQTITRRRKYQVEAKSAEVPIRFYIFDVLFSDEVDQTKIPLQQRKQLLKQLIRQNDNFFLTDFIVSQDPLEIRTYHEKQLFLGLEGVVVKKLNSVYESGRKGWSWVKMKEEEGTSGKLADTLDLVVMGYYLGKGKRSGLGLGAILVGVVDGENILTTAKIGTGMSDLLLQQLAKDCQQIKVKDQPKNFQVPKELAPDVWVAPQIVLEIAADEITKSPLHAAKFALRFPRLIKIRTDKNWQQATSLSELVSLAKLIK